MKVLYPIFHHQLTHGLPSLKLTDPDKALVLMGEFESVWKEPKHHKKKIAFLLAAQRHFAKELEEKGFSVIYKYLDEKEKNKSWKEEIKALLKKQSITKIVVTHPADYHELHAIQSWEKELGVSVQIVEDDRFLCTKEEFSSWAKGRKQLRMEFFYREMRKKYDILIDGRDPVGGQWNYDAENRKPPKEGLKVPSPHTYSPSPIAKEVMHLVEKHFGDHFGEMEPFYFALTRERALKVLEVFIEQRLPFFGDYQDAMIEGEPWMYHSHLSFYINAGLLLPLECIKAAAKAYDEKKAPLNAVEGFIRQIMGWREYVRGIYWLKMPEYAQVNFLEAKRPLPSFYWDGNTEMNCLKQCIQETKQNAYAHHIQRLMVLGNFALIAGIDPSDVNEWFWVVYADAYQWVELPNVSGMILFADGGYLASKPYAAGGSYINKMSNYCKGCKYKVSKKNGSDACPFNYLYWNFLMKNQKKLEGNQRLAMMYSLIRKMDKEKKEEITRDSEQFLKLLD